MIRVSKNLVVAGILAVVSAPALAEWTSVWDSAKLKTNSVEGQIKSIMVNEEDQEILVRIKEVRSDGMQTLKVCSGDQGGDLRSWQTSEKMALLRQAFSRGDLVRLSFRGTFDRCLSSIEYNAPTETARKASSAGSI